jgi:hypothetical protein
VHPGSAALRMLARDAWLHLFTARRADIDGFA